MRLDIRHGINLITYAKRQDDKEYLFRHYLTAMPYMGNDRKPFEKIYEDYERMTTAKIDTRTTDEIMAEILAIKV